MVCIEEFGKCPQKSDMFTRIVTMGFKKKSKILQIKSAIGAIADSKELIKPPKLIRAIIGVLIILAKTE